jgi:hypothetical protein
MVLQLEGWPWPFDIVSIALQTRAARHNPVEPTATPSSAQGKTFTQERRNTQQKALQMHKVKENKLVLSPC